MEVDKLPPAAKLTPAAAVVLRRRPAPTGLHVIRLIGKLVMIMAQLGSLKVRRFHAFKHQMSPTGSVDYGSGIALCRRSPTSGKTVALGCASSVDSHCSVRGCDRSSSGWTGSRSLARHRSPQFQTLFAVVGPRAARHMLYEIPRWHHTTVGGIDGLVYCLVLLC